MPNCMDTESAHAPQVPFSYCWSPAVVPKPLDWFGNIDVVGYYFLNEHTRKPFTPSDELRDFLAAGPPPVYIGELGISTLTGESHMSGPGRHDCHVHWHVLPNCHFCTFHEICPRVIASVQMLEQAEHSSNETAC